MHAGTWYECAYVWLSPLPKSTRNSKGTRRLENKSHRRKIKIYILSHVVSTQTLSTFNGLPFRGQSTVQNRTESQTGRPAHKKIRGGMPVPQQLHLDEDLSGPVSLFTVVDEQNRAVFVSCPGQGADVKVAACSTLAGLDCLVAICCILVVGLRRRAFLQRGAHISRRLRQRERFVGLIRYVSKLRFCVLVDTQ